MKMFDTRLVASCARFWGLHRVDIGALFCLVLVEVFVFNLPFWQTVHNNTPEVSQGELGPGLHMQANGTAIAENTEQAWRTISSTQLIQFLYMNPSSGESPHQVVRWSSQTRSRTDGGFYSSSGIKEYSSAYNNTRYWHVGGDANQLRIVYDVKVGDIVPIGDITINPKIPFHISTVRFILELLLLCLFVFFRPGSRLYCRMILFRDIKTIASFSMVIAMQVTLLVGIWFLCGGASSAVGFGKITWNGTWVDFDQYAHTAESLLKGKVSLDLPVNKDLAAMQNPYDAVSRFRVAAESKDQTPIFFDVAFRSGKYYSYFGVLPAILLFAPFRLISGYNLKTGQAILFLAILIIFASCALVVQLTRVLLRRGTRVSLGSVLLILCGALFCYPLFSVVQQQLFYQIPQLMSLFLVLSGISCWLESKLRNLSIGWLLTGIFLIGLTSACRPQFLAAGLVIFPLFGREFVSLVKSIRQSHTEFRKLIFLCVSAILIFAVSVGPALFYNNARFGSFLDFGANYNLTGYDMTHHHLPWSQLLPLGFLYFFQPANISTAFPFIQGTLQEMPIWLPMQPSFGGFFPTLAPFASVIFLFPFFKMSGRKNEFKYLYSVLSILVMIIFSFDAHIVGYDIRYILDFGWAIAIIYALRILSLGLVNNNADQGKVSSEIIDSSEFPKTVIALCLAGTMLAFVFVFFNLFKNDPTLYNEALWWNVRSWFLFI